MIKDKHIEQLLNRFLDGTSTLEEEAQLATYFRTHSVHREWRVYQEMFALFDRGEVEMKPQASTHHGWRWVAAAAALVLLALILPQLFKETPKQTEAPSLIAKADSTRTQRMDSTVTDKGIPEHVIQEIERIKHKTPRHLMAQDKHKKPAATTPVASATVTKRQGKPSVAKETDLEEPQGIAEVYPHVSIEEILTAIAQKEEAEVQAIRERGKQLERTVLAGSPGLY